MKFTIIKLCCLFLLAELLSNCEKTEINDNLMNQKENIQIDFSKISEQGNFLMPTNGYFSTRLMLGLC